MRKRRVLKSGMVENIFFSVLWVDIIDFWYSEPIKGAARPFLESWEIRHTLQYNKLVLPHAISRIT